MPSLDNTTRGWQSLPEELKRPILEEALVLDKPIAICGCLSRSSLEAFVHLLKQTKPEWELLQLHRLLSVLPRSTSPSFEAELLQIRFWKPNLFHGPSYIPFDIHKTRDGDVANFFPCPKFELDDPLNAAIGLFRVNHEMWNVATRIFYSQNRFLFPNGFVTMKAWLGVIGSNARWTRNLSVEAPLPALSTKDCSSKHQLGNMMMEFLLRAGESPTELSGGLRQLTDATIKPLSLETLFQNQYWTPQPGLRRNLRLVVDGNKWLPRLDEEPILNFDPNLSIRSQLEYLSRVPKDTFNLSLVFTFTIEKIELGRHDTFFKVYNRIDSFRKMIDDLGCETWVESWYKGWKQCMTLDQWFLLRLRIDFITRNPGVPLPHYLAVG